MGFMEDRLMFIDKKLNGLFNCNEPETFMYRLIHLARKNPSLETIEIVESPIEDECREFMKEAIEYHIHKKSGIVYVAMPENNNSILKIGRTKKSIADREKTLNTAGLPDKLKIVAWVKSLDSYMTESFIHQRLKEKHYNKEFFKVSIDEVENVIKESAIQTDLFLNRLLWVSEH